MFNKIGDKFEKAWSKCEAIKSRTLFLKIRDFPGGPVVKNLPTNAGDTGSILGPGRFHMLQVN